jgi:type I restriction enzyme M protein
VPDGVLFGSSRAHKAIRRILVEDQKLDAIISMPSGVFKPYAGVSTAILLFTRTNSGGTDHVWFYDMRADGFSLDDKRTPLGNAEFETRIAKCRKKGAPIPDDIHRATNLPDILRRWQNLVGEKDRRRTDQSFLVPQSEIRDNDYDLSINRYKEVEYEAVEHDPPKVILERLAKLEEEIKKGREKLEGLLG